MFQFVMSAIIASITLSGASLLWPRLTTQPRPEFLNKVHDVVVSTGPGQQAATVLGVSDEAKAEPFSLKALQDGVTHAVTNRVQEVVMGNAVNELSRQFDTLPKDQKLQIQEVLCKPLEENKKTTP